MSDLADFGSLISALGGGGDRGNSFPKSDADDFGKGARFIPGEVTLARRRGEPVAFAYECGPCCWFWEFQDGTRIYHYDPITYQAIGRSNNPDTWGNDGVLAGPCPQCGNEHTSGGTVEPNPDNPKGPKVVNTTSNPVDALGGPGFPLGSAAIPAMESAGQRQLVESTQLPVNGSDDPKILAMGITFGDISPGDDLFREATLPEGWKKEGSDHAMWSYIVDETGERRVAIFYKAAFYDRDAFMHAT